MRNKSLFLICLFCLVLLVSCGNNQPKSRGADKSDLNKSLEKANRYMVRTEEEDIADYIERHNDKMIATGTGLRYSILKKGEGNTVERGNLVVLSYDLYDLKGNLVYTSESEGLKQFVVGRGGVESGLEEAVLNLSEGDVAKIIIPSHLGFGLLGDQHKIKSKQTLVYIVKVIEVQ